MRMYKTEKRIAKAIRQATSHAVLLSSLLVFSPLGSAQENARMIDIPSQDLNQAIRKFSSETDRQILFSSDLVDGKISSSVVGRFESEEGLRELLRGTGLGFEVTPDNVILIRKLSDSGSNGAEQGQQGSIRVEEVYVTARKRQESIQDVPIAISAFTAADMRVTGIRNVGDMEGIVPGLNMGGGGSGLKKDSNPFIRGVGQRETKVTLDPAVGTYLDGIYLARTAGALLDTVGMERVEVLRGPQGTLFGRNTTGGAISFTSMKPHEELGGRLSVNVGNYGRSDALGVLNLPLIKDTLLSRFTLSSKNNDGYFTNVVDNTRWGDDDRVTGIGQLRWIATDNLMFDLFGERTRIRESPRPSKCAVVRPYDDSGSSNINNPNYNPDYFAPVPIRNTDLVRTGQGNPDNRKTYQESCRESEALGPDKFASDFSDESDLLEKGRYWIDTKTVGLTANWDIGEVGPLSNTSLKSISSWRQVEQIADEDLDATEVSQLLRIQDGFNETTQISQEFQFTGSAFNDRLFFSTGLYYFEEETPQDTLIRTAGIAQGNPYNGHSSANQGRIETLALEATRETLETKNEAYAWYGQLDYDITPRVQITAGLRYTHEKRWTAYSKAYATGGSMITSDPWPGATGGDGPTIRAYTALPGLASVWDWEFFSAQYPGRMLLVNWDSFEIISDNTYHIPGYENRSVYGVAYGRKEAKTQNSAWTPMVSIKYNANDAFRESLNLDDAMAYFTYSRGFGSGGVTSGAVDRTDRETGISYGGMINVEDPVIYDSQRTDNYEVGLKLQALDRRIQANMAVFYTDYTDMQVTSTANRAGIPVPFIDNVGKSVIKGFEGEFVFMPTANWRVILNTAYTDADLKEWEARSILLNFLTGQPMNEYTTVSRDDEPMPRVPRWQGYLLTDYAFNLPDGGILTPSIAARYTSEIYHGFDRGSYIYARDRVTSDAVTFVDARLSYISADRKMDITLWVKNLTDKDDYMVGAMPLVDTTGTIGEIYANPRTFGLEISYRFGGE